MADFYNHAIRKVTSAGVVSTLAGLAGSSGSVDGTGNAARFNLPSGVAVDATGNVYVADTFNHTIRKITPNGLVTTIAGQVGQSGFIPGALPGVVSSPQGIALFGTTLYATSNNAIVRITNVP